jgi:ankyrin repeat protein
MKRDLDSVKILLGAGASLDIRDNFGNTALTYAYNKNQREIIKEILKADKDFDKKRLDKINERFETQTDDNIGNLIDGIVKETKRDKTEVIYFVLYGLSKYIGTQGETIKDKKDLAHYIMKHWDDYKQAYNSGNVTELNYLDYELGGGGLKLGDKFGLEKYVNSLFGGVDVNNRLETWIEINGKRYIEKDGVIELHIERMDKKEMTVVLNIRDKGDEGCLYLEKLGVSFRDKNKAEVDIKLEADKNEFEWKDMLNGKEIKVIIRYKIEYLIFVDKKENIVIVIYDENDYSKTYETTIDFDSNVDNNENIKFELFKDKWINAADLRVDNKLKKIFIKYTFDEGKLRALENRKKVISEIKLKPEDFKDEEVTLNINIEKYFAKLIVDTYSERNKVKIKTDNGKKGRIELFENGKKKIEEITNSIEYTLEPVLRGNKVVEVKFNREIVCERVFNFASEKREIRKILSWIGIILSIIGFLVVIIVWDRFHLPFIWFLLSIIVFVLSIFFRPGSLDNRLMGNCKFGNLKGVRTKIILGADVNAKSRYGCTALMWASYNGRLEVVKELIEAGADVNAKDGYYDKIALIRASEKGHSEVVKELIRAGAYVNAVDKDYNTALMWASFGGHLEVVKELIRAGADVNAKGNGYWTALMRASEKGNVEVVKELIRAGADVNAKDGYGWTALMEASEKGHREVVKELIVAGADVNAKNRYGNTALTLARDDRIRNYLRSVGAKE